MRFRTEIEIQPFCYRIGYGEHGLAIGSCFADNISGRMRRLKFPVTANPLGVMYNPVSVAQTIRRFASERPFTMDELSTDGELWYSFAHHGRFADTDPQAALSRMNDALSEGAKALRKATYVIITMGTAWVYERGGAVVANCHKVSAREFVRRRLDVEQITEVLCSLMENELRGKNVILTVSPIRHIKDGLTENSISKAILRVAVEQIAERYANAVYFPAYEIMNDDLRDYRFYAPDMVHPSEVAVDYIWKKFCGVAIDEVSLKIAERVGRIMDAVEHRPFNPGSESHSRFLASMLARAENLAAEHLMLDLTQEIEYFKRKAETEGSAR